MAEPGGEEAHQHRGRIVRLEVNSFKSYRGHNVIGPFKCAAAAAGRQPPPPLPPRR